MRIAPDIEIPVDDGALGVERTVDLRDHRRAERFVGMLLLAHPLHTDRAARHRARDQRGVAGHIVGAVMTVAARGLNMDATDLLWRQPQELCQRRAERENTLGVR